MQIGTIFLKNIVRGCNLFEKYCQVTPSFWKILHGGTIFLKHIAWRHHLFEPYYKVVLSFWKIVPGGAIFLKNSARWRHLFEKYCMVAPSFWNILQGGAIFLKNISRCRHLFENYCNVTIHKYIYADEVYIFLINMYLLLRNDTQILSLHMFTVCTVNIPYIFMLSLSRVPKINLIDDRSSCFFISRELRNMSSLFYLFLFMISCCIG